jgi:CheY-like chemotaxis protein
VSRKKILLVDDSNTILMMEKMIFTGTPYELVTAANGRQAIEKAGAERPDLILLDVVMPELDGFETCRRLRQDPAMERTPIVMVTTRGEEENVDQGYAAGCNGYVTKPIDKVGLLTKVRSLLGEDEAVAGEALS